MYGARIFMKSRATVVSKCNFVLKALRVSVRDIYLWPYIRGGERVGGEDR
jgi:hypothetical protein